MAPLPASPALNPSLPAQSAELDSFVPLLSLPELAAAEKAFANEDYAAAALQVEAYVEHTKLSPLDELRWSLLLGTLREKAGDLLGAADAYDRASANPWPLWDYARLGRGRVLFALQDWENAETALSSVPEASAAYPVARGLFAESACRQGAAHACLERARAFKALKHKPPSWAGQAMKLAELLVNQLAVAAGTPAPAAVAGATTAPESPNTDDQLSALAYLRALIVDAPKTAGRQDALALERRLVEALPEPMRAREQHLSVKDQLQRAEAMEGAGRAEEAKVLSEGLLSDLDANSHSPLACQVRLIEARALLEQKQRSRAANRLMDIVSHCKGDDVRSAALYLSGRAAFQEEKYGDAERLLERLEHEAPRNRLADDARLYRAEAERELGDEAQFSALLESMPGDYPDGDMVQDGLFLLALHRMEKADWPGASSALARSVQLSGADTTAKHAESTGRERYFQARATVETGDVESGLTQYEKLIAELPLSYYMLHAYSRLAERDEARAKRALDAALSAVPEPVFRIEHRPEFDQPGFVRALELFRQSDIDDARRELEVANLLEPGASPSVLWGVALLYARAGSARLSHAVPRWQLHDWLERWPVGAWRQAWELAFPRPHIEAVTQAARRQGVEPALIYAVMREESAFDAEAVSPANAYGLMQIISPTARRFGKELGVPYDRRALITPSVNIALGSRVLANYQSYFPHDPLLAIPGYNAGPGKPKRWAKDWPSVDFDIWVELIPYRETRRDTKRVLASRAAYAFLYYRDSELDPLRLPRRLSSSAQN
jgi:soluble lytic murein transglycosylase